MGHDKIAPKYFLFKLSTIFHPTMGKQVVSQRLMNILTKKFKQLSLEGLIVCAEYLRLVHGTVDKTDTSSVRPLKGLSSAIATRIEELRPAISNS